MSVMRLTKKKGLSPVIATVLLTALAIILALIVFLWARGWISEQIEKNEKPISQVCDSVEFELYSKQEAGYLLVTIVNIGPVQIHSMDVKQEGKGAVIQTYNITAAPGQPSSEIKIPLVEEVERVIFYPQLLGSVKGKKETKVSTCLNKGKTISIN